MSGIPAGRHGLATDNDRMVRMSAGTKKCLLVAVVALIMFWLITRPTQSADVVHSSLGGLRDGADSIVTFVHNLFGSDSGYHTGTSDQDIQVIN
jgi:hypothetical protein